MAGARNFQENLMRHTLRFLSGGLLASAALAPTLLQAQPARRTTTATTGTPKMKTPNAPQVLVPDKVPLRITPQAQPFALSEVRLLDGPFKDAMQRDLTYLLSLEPDRFLHNFRLNAGLEPKAPIYGGWESGGVAGFSLGHYLSACAMAFATTGDARFKERLDTIVSELALCQSKRADGYVGAIPDGERIWREVAAGDIRSQGFDLNGGWVPWYTMHKLFAGLIDTYQLTGSQQAKSVLLKLADWAIGETAKLSPEQWQKMLDCEHGGMNESMANLYALTGEHKYLELSLKFNHHAILDPLSRGDAGGLPGRHANTQIPKVIGSARQYELTGNLADKQIAETFWKAVVHDHTYAIGGHSSGEHFGTPDKLSDRLTSSTCETCNTYNMLKLTRHLFEWSPQAAYMDFTERALYNHILASQNPKTGMMCYYVPLEPGGFKAYSTPTDSFWCCVGTGMENHVKYGESIYFHDASSLYVNLFIASELSWKQKGLTIRQETSFPQSPSTRLVFSAHKPVELTLHVRCPAWIAGPVAMSLGINKRMPSWIAAPMSLSINGQAKQIEVGPNGYASIRRVWKSGDVVQIGLPMKLHQEAMPDDARRVAMLYGPIVLAGELGSQDAPKPKIPVFIDDGKPLNQWLKPVAGQALAFRSQGPGRPQDVSFIPFYQMHDQRYSVYFDLFTQAGWEQRQAQYRAEEARLKALEARTVDFLQPGEMQPERDHNLHSDKSGAGEAFGRKWRDADGGGWFAFDLQVLEGEPQDLVLTYWGGETGSRVFDVLVDGQKIGSQTLQNNQPGQFFDVTLALPAEMTRGKKKVTVRLQAQPNSMAGGLFGARVTRRGESK